MARTRAGDLAAFGQLYTAHRTAAYWQARKFVARLSDVDDVVSEAWVRVFTALRNSRTTNPVNHFRAYLLTTVRHVAHDRARRDRHLVLLDADTLTTLLDQPAVDSDPAVAVCAHSTAELVRQAFATLPPAWRTVLRHLELEQRAPGVLGARLGLSPNGVAALACRAREGLRQRFLQAQVRPAANRACCRVVALLGAWTRNRLANRAAGQVRAHLTRCGHCRARAAELAELNQELRRAHRS